MTQTIAVAPPGPLATVSITSNNPNLLNVPANWFYDGESVAISSTGGIFSANQSLHLYECAEPGGVTSALTITLNDCLQDANHATATADTAGTSTTPAS